MAAVVIRACPRQRAFIGPLIAILLWCLPAPGRSEDAALSRWALPAEAGAAASQVELDMWRNLQSQRPIRARAQAEKLLGSKPNSYVARLVLGAALHYAEADVPRALFHVRQAVAAFETAHGAKPGPDKPWRWHARMLRELIGIHADLEQHRERLRTIRRYNRLYEPDMIAEQAWSWMKLGQFAAARRAARRGIASGDPRQKEVALNALCAIEFEAGHDGASYAACRRATEYARQVHGKPSAVDLTNFAEASRSLFKLAEAERTLLAATEAELAWYGNPWMELGELYTREARLPEALQALQSMRAYRSRRPPHVREADRNESWRALAAFLLVAGYPTQAIRVTNKALVTPDRRGHNSRDAVQDRAIIALLDRRARRVQAERLRETAAAKPLHTRPWLWLQAHWLRFQGWLSGKKAVRLLADDRRLIGMLRVGTSESAVMPPWLMGETVTTMGPVVVAKALQRARAKDRRPGAKAYYLTLAAEIAWQRGDDAQVQQDAQQALQSLGNAERLLRARVHALAGHSAQRRGDHSHALAHYDKAFQSDPGALRRLEIALPLQRLQSQGAKGGELAAALARSPRFFRSDWGLTLQVQADNLQAKVALRDARGQTLATAAVPRTQIKSATTAQTTAPSDGQARESHRPFLEQAAAAVLQQLFSPPIDLSQADIHSLDGSNRISRSGADGLGLGLE